MIRSNFDDTHAKILDCGKKHFLKNGFEKASLRDICKDAGVTTGAFYRHFSDKNELFEEVVSPIANKIIDNFLKYEKVSINGLKTNQEETVAKVHIDGTIETALFLFDNKEMYALLINGSFGSSYANFLEKDNSYEHISNKGFHIINHSHFLALTEAVLHSENKDELIENARLVSRFFSGGWKTVRGY